MKKKAQKALAGRAAPRRKWCDCLYFLATGDCDCRLYRAKPRHRPPPPFLTDAELADAENRNAAADSMRTRFDLGMIGRSTLARLVAEVRYWRGLAARSAPVSRPSRRGGTK